MEPQELGLHNLPSGPGELLHHNVKEELDTEPELGEGQLLTVLCGTLLEKFGGSG